MNNQKVRISVANLVPYLVNRDSGEVVAFGIANKKRLEQKQEFFLQALGGGATMTKSGRNYLEVAYGAEFQEKGENADDARSVVSMRYLDAIFDVFEGADDDFCEITPTREMIEELEQETLLDETILPPGALLGSLSEMLTVVRQLPVEGGSTSVRAGVGDVPTRRLFFIHRLCVSDAVFKKIMASPYVRRLSEEELNTTQMGLTKGVTRSGHPMADNLSNYLPGYL